MLIISLKNHHNKLMDRYIEDYTKGDDFDIVLICEGREIKCHKFVLKTFSNYFRSTFDNQVVLHYLSQKMPPFILLVVNMSYTNLKTLIDFMYFGRMKLSHQEIENILGSAKTLGFNDFDFNLDLNEPNIKMKENFCSNENQTDSNDIQLVMQLIDNYKMKNSSKLNGHSKNDCNSSSKHDSKLPINHDLNNHINLENFKLPPLVPKLNKNLNKKDIKKQGFETEKEAENFKQLISSSVSILSLSSTSISPSTSSSLLHDTWGNSQVPIKSYSSHNISGKIDPTKSSEELYFRCSLPEEAIKSSSRPLQFRPAQASPSQEFKDNYEQKIIIEHIQSSQKAEKSFDENVTQQSSELSSNEFELAPTDLPILTQTSFVKYSPIKIPPPFIPNVEYHCCLVCHLVDPSEFYVHLLIEETSRLDDIQEQLAHYYSEFSLPFDLPNEPKDFIGSCWAAIHPSDNLWYRVKIIDVANYKNVEDIKKIRILAHYVDYGNTEEISIGDLRPLRPDIAESPVLAVRCSLFNIQPIDEAWSFEATESFHKLSGFDKEKTVTIYVAEKQISNNFEYPLSVYLWNSDLALGEGKDILVNAALVRKNLAKTERIDWIQEAEKAKDESSSEKCFFKISNISSITFNDSKKSKEALDEQTNKDMSNWNTLNDDNISPLNVVNCNSDYGDFGTIGHKPKDLNGICMYYLLGYCKFGYRCCDRHLTPEEVADLNLDQVITEPFKIQGFDVGSNIRVTVTCVEHPFSFYVIMPYFDIRNSSTHGTRLKFNLDDYKKLFNKMTNFYSKLENPTNLNIFPPIGSFVAVFEKNQAYRAKVIDINLEDNSCLVQCIDTGTSSLVSRLNVFNLQIQFVLLPALALHCSLANVEPIEKDGHFPWSWEAIDLFRLLTLGKNFDARVVNINSDEKMSLELFAIEGEDVIISDILVNKGLAQSITINTSLFKPVKDFFKEKDCRL